MSAASRFDQIIQCTLGHTNIEGVTKKWKELTH